MTDQEILLDLLIRLAQDVHWTLKEMLLEALRWQPDEEANNSAVTIWHVSRAWSESSRDVTNHQITNT